MSTQCVHCMLSHSVNCWNHGQPVIYYYFIIYTIGTQSYSLVFFLFVSSPLLTTFSLPIIYNVHGDATPCRVKKQMRNTSSVWLVISFFFSFSLFFFWPKQRATSKKCVLRESDVESARALSGFSERLKCICVTPSCTCVSLIISIATKASFDETFFNNNPTKECCLELLLLFFAQSKTFSSVWSGCICGSP